jgi:amino acid transporter
MGQWTAILGVAIPIVAILMPVAIVFIALYFRHQRQVSLHETIKHLADKGMPVPKDLLDPPSRWGDGNGTRRRHSPFFGAMTVLGVGIGLMLFFFIMEMRGLWGIGALVATIGLVQLIALAFERRSVDKGVQGKGG